MEVVDLVVKGASEIVTAKGTKPLRGKDLRVEVYRDHGIVVRDGQILALMPEKEIKERYSPQMTIDAEGCCVTAGFVDAHTHIVFGGSRHEEFERRVKGATYKEISQEGGGIMSTVRATRQASEETLLETAWARLNNALTCGTTTLEIKSGYGLETETELKMLRVIKQLDREHPIDIVATFLGAHAIPPDFSDRPDDYVRLVTEEMLPQVAKEELAQFCDVFCEEGYFNVEQTEAILKRAKELGLGLQVHAEEFCLLGGAKLAAKLGAAAASHLLRVDDASIKALADSETVAVLLPAVSFFLKEDYAPARKMIDAGCAVALATDCNPGSAFGESMQFVLTLACLYLGMSPSEALAAATLNSACAVGMGETVGTLERGKMADILVWKCTDYREIPYHFGINQIKCVVKTGQLVLER